MKGPAPPWCLHIPCWKSHCNCCSVTQLGLSRCDPMVCSMPGLPFHHQFPEFTQTHVYWVGDAIQPSHPLSSPSPALKLCPQKTSGSFPWFPVGSHIVTVAVQLLSHVQLCDPRDCSTPGFPESRTLWGLPRAGLPPYLLLYLHSEVPRYYYLMQIPWVGLQMWTPPLKHQREELLAEPEHIAPGLLQPKE